MNEFNNYYIICHFIGREINYVYVYVYVYGHQFLSLGLKTLTVLKKNIMNWLILCALTSYNAQ